MILEEFEWDFGQLPLQRALNFTVKKTIENSNKNSLKLHNEEFVVLLYSLDCAEVWPSLTCKPSSDVLVHRKGEYLIYPTVGQAAELLLLFAYNF